MSDEGTTAYCGDNCNHTGPHRYPPTKTVDQNKMEQLARESERRRILAGLEAKRDSIVAGFEWNDALREGLEWAIAIVKGEQP